MFGAYIYWVQHSAFFISIMLSKKKKKVHVNCMNFLSLQMPQVSGTALKKMKKYFRSSYVYNPLMRHQNIQYGAQLISIILCHNF